MTLPSASMLFPPRHWGNFLPDHWVDVVFSWSLGDLNNVNSQCGQSEFIHALASFYICLPLTYLDIGSNDGITQSSTFFLELQGWRGICVEPNPVCAIKCLSNRPNASVIFCGVSDFDGFSLLSTSDNLSALGSFSELVSSRHLIRLKSELMQVNEFATSYLCPVLKASLLFNKCQELFSEVGFLKVDAEGLEYQILVDILRQITNRPYLIEYENNYRESNIALLLSSNGYNLILVMDGFVEIWKRFDIALAKHDVYRLLMSTFELF
jgi:FkbM family methyltransferase